MRELKIVIFAAVFGAILFGTALSAGAETYGDLKYEVSNGEVAITRCEMSVKGELIIDGEIAGYPVTSIGKGAFSYCRNLTSITIPKGVTNIGNSAFSNCSSLTSITILGNVSSIGEDTFFNCYELTSITIPDSVTSIGDYAFSGCKSLTNITIPNSVTSIGRAAFSNCSSLTSITIPNSVTSIGSWAFSDCSSLTSITIPSSVTSIGYAVLFGCSSLTGITIPESVISIGSWAFRGCSSLTSITIPKGVTSIGEFAFFCCDNLTNIYYLGNADEWKKIEIEKKNDDLTNAEIIYVVRVYKFETNGGSAVADIYNKISECPETVYDGKTFLGWFDNAELSGEPISFPYSGDKTTLYAKWADDSAVKVSLRACSKENGFYNYEFYIISPKAFCGSFIVAGYTKDGKLNEITRNPLEKNTSEYDVSGSIKIKSETSFYRYFLWGGENGVTPLCQSEEIDFKSIN